MSVPAAPRKQHDTQHLKHTVQNLFGNQMSLREKQKEHGKTTIQQQVYNVSNIHIPTVR
jgi:hypothetical protein